MMKKIWLTALVSFLPLTAGAEVYTLPGVVVTAEGQKESTLSPRETITEKDMKRMGASNVVEALAMAEGLSLAPAGQSAIGGRQLMIRGMNSSQTLVLVDGHRLADEDTSSSRNMMILNRMSLSDIQEIQVTRGPDGALCGSSAMGGVIDIRTKKPGSGENLAGFMTGKRENTAYFRLDPMKEGRLHVAVDGRIIKNRPLAFYRDSSLSGRADRGWDVPSYGIRRYIGLDSLYDFENENDNTLRFQLHYFDEDQDTRFADTFYGGMALLQNQKSTISRSLWDTSLAYEGNTGKNEYSGQVYYSRLRKNYEETRLDMMKKAASEWDRALYETWGMEAKDRLHLGNHDITVGGEWTKDTYTGTRLSDIHDGREEGREQHSGAIYGSDLWQINSRLTFAPAIRFEKGNRCGFVGIPSAGFAYKVNDHMKVTASYGKGFRTPTISEMYIHMKYSGRLQIDGNPDLSPETSRNMETGLEWQAGKTGWKISWFDQKVKNLIDYEEIGKNSGKYMYVNRNRAQLQGLEGEITHKISSRWTIRGTYTYLDGRDKSAGTRLPNRSRHTLIAALSYEGENPYGISGTLWSTLQKDYLSDEKNYTWNELNLSLQKHWGKYTLTLGMYNILNRKIDALYQDGRAWFAGMEMKW